MAEKLDCPGGGEKIARVAVRVIDEPVWFELRNSCSESDLMDKFKTEFDEENG